ncbi:MAG: UDP-3-O-(3-hydroxymyristoyl)glucosamine N-acyltransferase, partial [Flavobacteriales bacterium]
LFLDPMEFSAREIAQLLEGEVEGDPDVKVRKLCKIEEGEEGGLSFLANPKYTEFIYGTSASIVIVEKDFEPKQALPESCTLIRVPDPYQGFASLLEHYEAMRSSDEKGFEEPYYSKEEPNFGASPYVGAFSYFGKNVRIGDRVKIHPHCYIGDDVTIGSDTEIGSGCHIHRDSVIGNNCLLHPGIVLGSDGFGFAPGDDQSYTKVTQTGNVVVEDRVEIGSNCTIDRATLGSTVIREGVKLDNLIQIAHNVEIGKHTVIAAQSGIAGSTRIGERCMIGGQVGIIGHLRIADGVKIAAQSGIGNNIDQEGAVVQGSPAFAIGDQKRSYVVFRQLPELQKKIQELEQRIQELDQTF